MEAVGHMETLKITRLNSETSGCNCHPLCMLVIFTSLGLLKTLSLPSVLSLFPFLIFVKV